MTGYKLQIVKKFKQLLLQTLDNHLASISVCDRPGNGWIAAIRKCLGMSAHQLAKRIGIARQSVSELEARERDGSITLKSLRKAAEAMDCQLVYALIPQKGKLKDIVKRQALKKAKALVEPVDHTMMLEGQAVGGKEEKIKQIAEELADNIGSKLWD